MFTGIVEEVGVVRHVAAGERTTLEIACERVLERLAVDDLVCLAGTRVCVAARDDRGLTAATGADTAARTTLGSLVRGSRVNLERAATPLSALGGHLVRGEVDTTAKVLEREAIGTGVRLRLALGPEVARYVTAKGSIALDGVSLTVARVGKTFFEVAFPEETARRTTLGSLRAGETVNVEADVVARYVERLLRRD